MDLGASLRSGDTCASMEPAQNQTLAQGLQYVLIIGSAFGRRPEWQAVQNGRWRCINLP